MSSIILKVPGIKETHVNKQCGPLLSLPTFETQTDSTIVRDCEATSKIHRGCKHTNKHTLSNIFPMKACPIPIFWTTTSYCCELSKLLEQTLFKQYPKAWRVIQTGTPKMRAPKNYEGLWEGHVFEAIALRSWRRGTPEALHPLELHFARIHQQRRADQLLNSARPPLHRSQG